MKITVYGKSVDPSSKDFCGYCANAKTFLERRNYEYEYISVLDPDFDIVNLKTNIAPGASTVPVIIVDGVFIGGFDQLIQLEHVLHWRKIIQEAATAHAVKVVFLKEDDSVRAMIATLNPNRIANILGPNVSSSSEHGLEPTRVAKTINNLHVLDIEKQAWRSIPLTRIVTVEATVL